MKAIKTTIAILASSLAIGAIAQSADSASVTASDIANLTGQQTSPIWNELGLNGTQGAQVTGAINANNALINQELAKRDATIADLQNQLSKLKTSSSSANLINGCPYSQFYKVGGGYSIISIQSIPKVGIYSWGGSHSGSRIDVSCQPPPAPPGYELSTEY